MQKPEPNVATNPKRMGTWAYVAVAAISIALVSSFMAYDFYGRWMRTVGAFEDIANSNEILAQQNNSVNNRLDKVEGYFAVLESLDFNRVQMTSVVEGQSFAASVYWNEKTEEAYLSSKELKELTKEQQYHLWATVAGKSVDLGEFDARDRLLTKMTSVANATTFFVTIEPKGGSSKPMLSSMQVQGKVQ